MAKKAQVEKYTRTLQNATVPCLIIDMAKKEFHDDEYTVDGKFKLDNPVHTNTIMAKVKEQAVEKYGNNIIVQIDFTKVTLKDEIWEMTVETFMAHATKVEKKEAEKPGK